MKKTRKPPISSTNLQSRRISHGSPSHPHREGASAPLHMHGPPTCCMPGSCCTCLAHAAHALLMRALKHSSCA
jgi:hypothetical protein